MKIAIVGTGYVGLVTGVSLALLNHKVLCVDKIEEKVSVINNGKTPFYESGLDKLLIKVLREKKLSATTDLEKAVVGSDITIIAVGTPTTNNKIDLSYIRLAAKEIGEALTKVKKYHVVAVKSTVLPGVTQEVVKPILEKYSKKRVGAFGLCMNPEFLREGSAVDDALHPDRIVIGQIDEKSGHEFARIYEKVSTPKIFTNLNTAEMIKYTANSLFATLISYSNEISRISESIHDVDVVDIWKAVHLDRRLSPQNGKARIKPEVLSYIFSGCGFGGSCFPKDIKALASFAEKLDIETPIIKSVIKINTTQYQRIIFLLKKALGKNLQGKRVAVLGLAFKPNTDDTRESVAFPLIEELHSHGVKVVTHDPMVKKENPPQSLVRSSVVLVDTVREAISNADAVIIVTAWKEYIDLTPKFFKKYMKNPIIIDGRRIYDKSVFLSEGIIYKGIGYSGLSSI